MTYGVNRLTIGLKIPRNAEEESSPIAKTAEKIRCALASAFQAMGYAAYLAGVLSLAAIGLMMSSGAPMILAMQSIPAYLALSGGAVYLLGEILENLGDRQIVRI